MREILFRAKRQDNGEWIEGNLIYTPENDDDFECIIVPRCGNGRCIHSEVCSKKEKFLEAQRMVDDLEIHLEPGRSIKLSAIGYIKPVELQCTYWTKKPEVTLR